MKRSTIITLCLAGLAAQGQVHVDRPVRFVASDSTQRQVDGLGAPQQESSLSDLGTAQSGSVHFAQPSGSAAAILLAMEPTATQYTSGMLIRFIPVMDHSGMVTVNVDGLGPRTIRRNDLLLPTLGDLKQGQVVELQYTDSVFLIIGRANESCPSGYLPVNGRFCVQASEVNGHTWFQAVRYCADRGARLCTWDEYHHACVVQGSNMTGMHDDWEWFDDTADHTHTAVQGGRWTCQSERSIGAVDAEVHTTRCCYRLR